jgi:hypothetical protein
MGACDGADDDVGPGLTLAAGEAFSRVDAGELRLDLELAMQENVVTAMGKTRVPLPRCGGGGRF